MRSLALFKRPEFVTVLVCIILLLQGMIPEATRQGLCGVILMATAVVAMIAALNSATECERRLRRLESHSWTVEDRELVQRDAADAVVGRIGLDREYRVSIPHTGNAEGIYRLEQDDTVIELSSRAPNAEHIVRNVLGLQSWPPDTWINGP